MELRRNFVAYFLRIILLISVSWYHGEGTESTNQLPPFSCDSSNPSIKSLPFCNTNLAIKERVLDLVSRLTLDEKISQLVNTAPAIPRFNISAYQWWSEALHGVSRHGKGTRFNGTLTSATIFPQVILTASSFDVNLWFRIGKVCPNFLCFFFFLFFFKGNVVTSLILVKFCSGNWERDEGILQ